MFENVTIEQLRAARIKTFREGRGTRPEVSLIQIDDELAVLKDFSRADPWFSFLIGPWIASREARALRLLDGVTGIPRLIRRMGSRAVLMEYVKGRTAKELPRTGNDPELFRRVSQLVGILHERGVAHCDLRSGGNTVISQDGQPYFVDFVGHFIQGHPWNLPWRWAFDRFCQADQIAVVRLKRRLAPELLTPEDRRLLELDKKHPIARLARLIGGSVRKLSRILLTRKSD